MKLNIYFLFRINVSMPYIDLYSQLHTCTNKYDAHAELSKKLYNVTPRVLQIYPPKTKSRPEISCA